MSDFDVSTVQPGDFVWVRDAAGKEHRMRAVSGLLRGLNFTVVKVCPEWAYPVVNATDVILWPADAVLGIAQPGGDR